MTAGLLLKSIRTFLEQQAASYAAAIGMEAPTVFDWDLPFPNPLQPEGIAHSYICVRPATGLDRDEATPPDRPDSLLSTVGLETVFGIYRGEAESSDPAEADGYDLLNLMEHVRSALLEQRILDGKFAIEKPYQWEISREQPSAFWIGQATSIWSVPSIAAVWEGVHLHGGSTASKQHR